MVIVYSSVFQTLILMLLHSFAKVLRSPEHLLAKALKLSFSSHLILFAQKFIVLLNAKQSFVDLTRIFFIQ